MAFNQFGFQEVDYDTHYQQFAAPFLIEGNAENNRYFLVEAQQNHVYGVNNALLELLGDALTLLSKIPLSRDATHFFHYGVMRRLRMIDSSFKSFQNIIPPSELLHCRWSSPIGCVETSTRFTSIYLDFSIITHG